MNKGKAAAAGTTKHHGVSAKTLAPVFASEKNSTAPSNTSASAQLNTTAAPPARTSESAVTPGEVLDRVLPNISQKARDTIRGTVRVSVHLRVDASGTVDSAELEAPASSKFFADKAIDAAKLWQFTAPEVSGRPVESEWVVQFEFTPNATNASPEQVLP
jgi:TonB family protein